MSVATFDSIKDHNTRLIRKALEGSVFMKRWAEDDTPITQVYKAATGLVIPVGYFDVGVISKADAISWNRDTDTSDVESWGYGDPTRRDIIKDTSTVEFTMQESKRHVLEVYNSTDLSGVQADADGNVIVDKPRIPRSLRWRMFSLAKDGDGADAIYFLRSLPHGQVTSIAEQKWSEDEELSYKVTLTGFVDDAWGTAVREVWGGPGFDAVDAGYLPATP